MKTKELPIGSIKANQNNPRIIKDDKFKKLVISIKEFHEMLQIRPIVVNNELIDINMGRILSKFSIGRSFAVEQNTDAACSLCASQGHITPI